MKSLFGWLSADRVRLAEMSVVELCDMRGEIEAELHRRAIERLGAIPDRSFLRGDPGDSDTWISADRSEVFVKVYEQPDRFATMDDALARRFPRVGARAKAFQFQTVSYGRDVLLPLSMYEAGPDAIRAHCDAEERERAATCEMYEREQYEKLKAKFG